MENLTYARRLDRLAGENGTVIVSTAVTQEFEMKFVALNIPKLRTGKIAAPFLLCGAAIFASAALAEVPASIDAPGATEVLRVHAEGAQVYDCKADGAGKSKDIPWLKLEVVSRRGTGILTDVTTVQRINTQGGKLDGACERAGTYQSMPYSADYVFLR